MKYVPRSSVSSKETLPSKVPRNSSEPSWETYNSPVFDDYYSEQDYAVVVEDDTETISTAARLVETFFAVAIIFALTIFPFVLGILFIPTIMTTLMMFPFSLLAIPYAFLMIVLGLKLSSLLGCSLWERLWRPIDTD